MPKKNQKLRVIPLGGINEIGENMTRGNIVTGSVHTGCHVGSTNIRLSCAELGVFLHHKLEGGNWLEEGLLEGGYEEALLFAKGLAKF